MRALGVNSSALYHYKQSIDNNRAKPPSEQRPLTACRTSGGGRKSKLTPEQEAEVKRHILSIRRSPARPRVTRVMVQLYIQDSGAVRLYGLELGRKGIANLLRRQRLSDRKRTTTKEVNTPRMQEIKRHWTSKFASFFATTNHQWIINIDETSVYRDAPGDSTIDEVGANTVEIGKDELASKGVSVESAVLFMDNCPAHECDEVVATMRGGGITYEFFPPKCTPLLQPLDQSVNQLFGLEYAKKYEEWYMTKGAYDFTPAGNLRRATDDEVNKWIAHALVAITPHIVRVSWERATSAPLHVMRLPGRPWEKVMSFLPPALARVLTSRRVLFDGSQFVFPVSWKRKRKTKEAMEGGAQVKKRRGGDEEEVDRDEWVGEWGEGEDEEEEEEEDEEEKRDGTLVAPPNHLQLRLHPSMRVMS